MTTRQEGLTIKEQRSNARRRQALQIYALKRSAFQSQVQIARLMGLSPSRVSQIVTSAYYRELVNAKA